MHNNVDGGPVYGWAVVLSLHRLKFLEKVLDIHRALLSTCMAPPRLYTLPLCMFNILTGLYKLD